MVAPDEVLMTEEGSREEELVRDVIGARRDDRAARDYTGHAPPEPNFLG